MEIICFVCYYVLECNGDIVYCEICVKDFLLQVFCFDCCQLLQVLKVCGVVDYFCQNGYGLILKKWVNFVIFD